MDIPCEDGLLFLILRNDGPGPAHEVTARFSSPVMGPDGRVLTDLSVFGKVGFLAPGRGLKVFVDTYESYSRRGQPKVLDVVVSFRDSGGRRRSERMHHDLSIYDDLVELTGRIPP